VETNRIVFMIPHNRLRMSGLYHVSDYMQCLTNLRSAIYKISNEQNLPAFRMTVYSSLSNIAHFLQQLL